MPQSITTLFYSPTGQYVEARIVELTAHLADREIHRGWWEDSCLLDQFDPPPIDLHWNWNEMGIEYDGKPLASEKYAIVTGDNAVQGAMMMCTDTVPSVLAPSRKALFVEMLFTAPRNRPTLRRDGGTLFQGVGLKLLAWAALQSQRRRQGGRLLLHGSPDYVAWYEKRGLQKLKLKPIVFEGVPYTPMELPSHAAKQLIKALD